MAMIPVNKREQIPERCEMQINTLLPPVNSRFQNICIAGMKHKCLEMNRLINLETVTLES